jgi:hypothetical protein
MELYIQESGIDDTWSLPEWLTDEEIIEIIKDWSQTLLELRFLG